MKFLERLGIATLGSGIMLVCYAIIFAVLYNAFLWCSHGTSDPTVGLLVSIIVAEVTGNWWSYAKRCTP